ncbi:hypothetical protein IFM89_011303 [Coptis chinensis]|uniref:Large ribosomal subunit protein bL33c n=1 Tax=Coptis chinensis TaxID=261450 RepID=A0A835HSH2_9MAGN|nr:hypothetical protein IFM89_011303 [Coptis chinensis]
MIFYSVADLFEYYLKYGNENGFPVKKRSSRTNDNGEVRWVAFACSRHKAGAASSLFQMLPVRLLTIRQTKFILVYFDFVDLAQLHYLRVSMGMTKGDSIFIRLVSAARTGFFYVKRKNPRKMTEKLEFRKYDPWVNCLTLFTEAKMK